ncbi:huntingtin-associated protein 1 isoform X1 [Pongo abelii]|uniref:huntingtin-associated protein 1 isoform X1 n=1 Tax=Pongo abelii TaxID=9601 RepID=UPI003004798C
MPDNSDAPWTRFVFQGPFGSRATGLGTGKAAGIWKTPAAYIGQRPGMSGPERAAFIRELEEALCPNVPPPVKKITQEDVKVMLYLLEERKRDLNTTACIGQSLVKQNSVLMEENSKLEALLGSAKEEILHLRHQVNLRDDLLQLYSDSDEEDEDEEEEEEEEEAEEDQQHAHPCDAPKLISQEALLHQHHCPQLEALQEKLRLLEEENHQLREEASQLDTLEDEEQVLILECVEQFSEASQQMAELLEVLVFRLENYERQQQEVAWLQAQVLKLQQRCRMYGAETEKLQKQLASEKEIQMQLQEEETLPGFQEMLAEELRMSLRRMISDPVYFMERNYEMPRGDTSSLRYDFRYSEDREQVQGFEAEEGLMLAADIMWGEDFTPAEELVPEEELGAAEKVPAEEGVMEEAELVSEETEGWEEVEPELDEATRMSVVTSALEASGLGPSHLDMKYVLQQLANWQNAHYRRQLRRKMLQKGSPTLQQWQQQSKQTRGGGMGLWSSPGADPGWRTGPATLPWPGRKRGLLGLPRLRGQRPPPARATVGTVPWALLFPSSLRRPHRQLEAPPSAAWPSPTPADPLSHPLKWDPVSVTSPPSVFMNLGWSLGTQASNLFRDRR